MATEQEAACLTARFGGFEVDLRARELIRGGRTIRLADKPFEVLLALLEQPGHVVTRDELRIRLWSDDTFVDFDNNLNATVSRLREALHDSAQGPRFVETIPKRGYRYVGPPPTWDGEGAPPGRPETRPNRWPWAIAAAVAVATVVALLPRVGRVQAPIAAERLLLAVLPFEDLGTEPSLATVATGLTEELAIQIGRLAPDRLGVIARTSTRHYAQTGKSIAELGAELGVAFVVEGSVRGQSGGLRVAAKLVRVSDQAQAWANAYDRQSQDLLAIQTDIAARVVAAIRPTLLPDGIDPTADATGQPDAFDRYLEARAALAGDDVPSSRRAAELLERALALDPTFARAWAALATANNAIWFGAADAAEAERIASAARAAATRALELAPDLPEARLALAFSLLYHAWDPVAAAEALGPSRADWPHLAEAQQLAAAVYAALGQVEASLAAALVTRELDPTSAATATALGWTYLFAGRPAEAEALCRSRLAAGQGGRGVRGCLAHALIASGELVEAARVTRDQLRVEGIPGADLPSLEGLEGGAALAELGRARFAYIRQHRDDAGAAFDAAASLVAAGEREQALVALGYAVEVREPRLLFLAVDPRFASLRPDPRFQAVVRRVVGGR